MQQLSLQDIGRLDSAMLIISLRPGLLDAFVGLTLHGEQIISTEMIDWVMSKGVKLLRVKIIEDVRQDELLRFVEYCPQLISLNTWGFEDDCKFALKKSRIGDDKNAEYEAESFSVDAVATISQTCKQLKCFRLCDADPSEWFPTFSHIVPLFSHLEEFVYREKPNDSEDTDDEDESQLATFCLRSTSLKLCTATNIFPLPQCSQLHALQDVLIDIGEADEDLEAELLQLADANPALQRAALAVSISNETLVEFCRLCPNLLELQLQQQHGVDYDTEGILQALQLLPGNSLTIFAPLLVLT